MADADLLRDQLQASLGTANTLKTAYTLARGGMATEGVAPATFSA